MKFKLKIGVFIILSVMICILSVSASDIFVSESSSNNGLAATDSASITIYIKNSSGTSISGKVQLYYASGTYYEYNVPTGGLKITGLTANKQYGFNIIADGYAKDTTFQLIPAAGANTTKTFTLKSYSSFPNFSAPLTSYTAPSQASNQHFGWRNNDGLDYHTGVDISRTSNGTSFASVLPNAYSVCNGIIKRNEFVAGAGNVVQIEYTNGTTYYISYLHLKEASCGSTGEAISVGEVVGIVGNTLNSSTVGDASMPVHLHISVSTNTSISKTSRKFLDPKAFELY